MAQIANGHDAMSRPDIIDKNKASSHPLRPGRFYTAKVKKVHTDGKVTVSIQELGLNIGPVVPLDQVDNNPYEVGDYVKCGFSDEFFNELIIFGSVVKKQGVFALKTEAGSVWTELAPTVAQGTETNVANTHTYSKYATIGAMRTWNCLTEIGASGDSGEPIIVSLPEASAGTAGLVVGSAVITCSGTGYLSSAVVYGAGADSIAFWSTSDNYIGSNPNVQLAASDTISFSISYEVAG